MQTSLTNQFWVIFSFVASSNLPISPHQGEAIPSLSNDIRDKIEMPYHFLKHFLRAINCDSINRISLKYFQIYWFYGFS